MSESTIEPIENAFCTIQFGFSGPSIVKIVLADVENLEGVNRQLARLVVEEVDKALDAVMHSVGNTIYSKTVQDGVVVEEEGNG